MSVVPYDEDDEDPNRRFLLASVLILLAGALTAFGTCGGAVIGVPPEFTLLPAAVLLIPGLVLLYLDWRDGRRRRR